MFLVSVEIPDIIVIYGASLPEDNVDNVAKYSKMNTSKLIIETVSKETLETAAKMFTYLNACSPNQLLPFYKELFTTASTKQILLALTSIYKTSNSLIKEKCKKLITKVLQKLQLIPPNNFNAIVVKENGITEENEAFGDFMRFLDEYGKALKKNYKMVLLMQMCL